MIVSSPSRRHNKSDFFAKCGMTNDKTLVVEDATDEESESSYSDNDSESVNDSDSDSSSYDACDQLFQQGDLLRRLRQMEREDEALREKERIMEQQQQDSESNTLRYQDYLDHQEGIYDDYKHVNYQYIDFGVVPSLDCENDIASSDNNSETLPLVIEQDRTVGKGGFVWDAGVVLAESVLRMTNETQWLTRHRNTRIIELGAGTGVTSLMIAKAVPNATVHLTDLPVLQPLLSKNCRSCCPSQATHGVLEWGQRVSPDMEGSYDVILGADVVAGIYDASGLAQTIFDLSHSQTIVYLACRERLAGVIDRFVGHLEERFAKIERREADSSNKSPNVYILKVCGKRSDFHNSNIIATPEDGGGSMNIVG